jgi:hypothetical protein
VCTDIMAHNRSGASSTRAEQQPDDESRSSSSWHRSWAANIMAANGESRVTCTILLLKPFAAGGLHHIFLATATGGWPVSWYGHVLIRHDGTPNV